MRKRARDLRKNRRSQNTKKCYIKLKERFPSTDLIKNLRILGDQPFLVWFRKQAVLLASQLRRTVQNGTAQGSL